MNKLKSTHRLISHEIEAWFYAGKPYAEAPDWVRAKFSLQELLERPIGRYALRDEEGKFWKWLDANKFNEFYERIIP